MKTLRTLGTLAVAGSVLTFIPVGSAMADPTGNTDATFTVAIGGLSVTAAPNAPHWTDAASGATSVTGDLGQVEVHDTRGGIADWEVTAVSTDFINPIAGGTTSSGVSYDAGVVTTDGVVTTTVNPDEDVMSEATVVSGTDIRGNNTATFHPSLTVTLPSNALAGAYEGTVTTSVA